MAKIVERIIAIKFSKIIKDSEEDAFFTIADIEAALEQVAQELAGDNIVVEVERV